MIHDNFDAHVALVNEVHYVVTGDGVISVLDPCFAKDTMITLADRTTKPVQDITYSDVLLVWDFDKGCISSAKPVWIKKAQTADYYYRCEFENGVVLKLIGSDGNCHRVFSLDDNRFEYATNCVGKTIMTESGATKLLSCDRVDEAVEHYNIITHTHINLYAGTVLTSCRLNNMYPIQDMKFVKDDRTKRTKSDYTSIIGNDMFVGLRLSEQHTDINELNSYIKRLYALIDWKPRYYVRGEELTQIEYMGLTGNKEEHPYVSKLYHGEITAEEVPEEIRANVESIVRNRINRWGVYVKPEVTSNKKGIDA